MMADEADPTFLHPPVSEKDQGSKTKGKEDKGDKTSRSEKPEKSRLRKCNMCAHSMSDSYKKPICKSCIDNFMREEKTSFLDELKGFIEEKISSSVAAATSRPPPCKKPRVEPDSSISEGGDDSEAPSCSYVEDEDPTDSQKTEDSRHLFQFEELDGLLKAIRQTLEIEEILPPRSKEEELFGGLKAKRQRVFPLNDTLKELVSEEWQEPEKRVIVSKNFKKRLVFEPEESKVWDTCPKMDVQVTKIVKKTDLPFEDAAQLKDPMDRKSDSLLRKAWETSMLSLKTNLASTSVARNLLYWLNELESHIKEGTPRSTILENFPLLKSATAFLADSAAEGIRFASKEGALTNSTRRALWLKQWNGDIRSKAKLCSLPFSGEFVFGPELDAILERASDKKKGFPERSIPKKQPFRDFKKDSYKDKGKRGRWSYPKGGKGRGFLFSTPTDPNRNKKQ
ncbi:uncharacterized protein [Engystomops pustulosus]|uniref:uncharacterized protein n=1 Tax=Engystomops pustulosus TaxID=76066 RepID=UPI003AFA36F0